LFCKQRGEKLTGTYDGQLGRSRVTGNIKSGAIKGKTFELSFDVPAGTMRLWGTLESNGKMKGQIDFPQGKGLFIATRTRTLDEPRK